MIRFIHTADWQIGMKAAGLGAAGQQVRQARMDSIRRIVAVAEEREVPLLLVTGDVFEDNAVDRLLIRKVGEILGGYKGKVYITPGNHDPLVPGSVWEHSVWDDLENVTVVRDAEPIVLDDCVLYPCPLKAKYSTRNPVSWVDATDSEHIAIGMAHGTVEGLPGMEPDYPISRDAASRAGLDYLGIGHWHSFASFADAEGAVRMAYAGTHETTKFGERDSGNVLLVEIDRRGAVPRIEPLATGVLRWYSLEPTLEQDLDLTQVLDEVKTIDDPSRSLVRVRLSGLLRAADRQRLVALEEMIQSRFLYGSIDSAALIPAPEDDAWIEALPAGHVREAGQKILQQAESAGNERDKAVATRALLELFALNERSGA